MLRIARNVKVCYSDSFSILNSIFLTSLINEMPLAPTMTLLVLNAKMVGILVMTLAILMMGDYVENRE